MRRYVDVVAASDFDRVMRFLHQNEINPISRHRTNLRIVAELSDEQVTQMHKEAEFKDVVTIKESPL